MATIDDIKKYLTDATVTKNPVDYTKTTVEADIFKKAAPRKTTLEGFTGKLNFDETGIESFKGSTGSKASKIKNMESLVIHDEALKEALGDLERGGHGSNKSSQVEKMMEKNKRQLEKGASGAFTDASKIAEANGKYRLALIDDNIKFTNDMLVAKTEALAAAGTDATKIATVNTRFEEIMQVHSQHYDVKMERVNDIDSTVKAVVEKIEKVSGLKSEAAKAGGFAEKVLGKEAGAVTKEAGGLKGFIMKNPIATAIGAAVVGALAMSLMGGSSKESGRA